MASLVLEVFKQFSVNRVQKSNLWSWVKSAGWRDKIEYLVTFGSSTFHGRDDF